MTIITFPFVFGKQAYDKSMKKLPLKIYINIFFNIYV